MSIFYPPNSASEADLLKAWEYAATQSEFRLSPRLGHRLLSAWQEPHRHYHTLQHLYEGLSWLAKCQEHLDHPLELFVAFWFHDAIYDTRTSDSEARSATWARAELESLGWSLDSIDRITSMIEKTAGHSHANTLDEAFFLDIDLSILGSSKSRFSEYESQIKQEYSHVPSLLYGVGRSKVMRAFACRAPLFLTPFFRDALEKQASVNLQIWSKSNKKEDNKKSIIL